MAETGEQEATNKVGSWERNRQAVDVLGGKVFSAYSELVLIVPKETGTELNRKIVEFAEQDEEGDDGTHPSLGVQRQGLKIGEKELDAFVFGSNDRLPDIEKKIDSEIERTLEWVNQKFLEQGKPTIAPLPPKSSPHPS